jgi:protein-L-isoaspartate O-methyltransferase
VTRASPAADRIRLAVELLDLRPADRVLEIGCGAGHAVALVAERLTNGGMIVAIDRSAVMVARARALNGAAIAAGRALIDQATLAEAAQRGAEYDKVFAVNVNAFWTAPSASLAALARLVRAGGVAALVYEPPSAARMRELEETLPPRFEEAGFHVVEVRTHHAARHGRVAVMARRLVATGPTA